MHPLERAQALPTAAVCLLVPFAVANAQPSAAELPAVEVIGTTPLPGAAQPLRDVPVNARVYGSRALEGSGPAGAGRLLDDRGASFSTDDTVGNRFGADLSFRGFTASPLLGSAQGLSVFLDGVRINESFGDVVNWDLLPRNALASITVLPGAAPSFGLNTLGGALSLVTRSGASDPGTDVELGAGSWGQRAIEASHGAAGGGFDWFVAGTASQEDGWREQSSSRLRQLFAKGGWSDARTRIELSASGADNRLNGTQALPISWLDTPRAPYTFPDENRNRLAFANAIARRQLGRGAELSGRVFVRDLRHRAFNSNVNDDCTPLACPHTAFNDALAVDERRHGVGLQWLRPLQALRVAHRLVAGASHEQGRVTIEAAEQEADFTPGRGTVGLDDFEPGTQARTRQRSDTGYLADTVALGAARLTAALTYVSTRLEVRDASGSAPELDGDHRFTGWLPAFGATLTPWNDATLFASLARGMRAPTAIELTCADPDTPCRLPNQFLADPPLKAVRARSGELGVRAGGRMQTLSWRGSAALFRVDLDDDIQFVSAGGAATNAGYFRNVGRTRRQGAEVAAQVAAGAFSVEASWLGLKATYRDPFTAFSPNNSSADANGDIAIAPGARLPGIPQQVLKLRLGWESRSGHAAGLSLQRYGARFARGDENNGDANGPLPGYTLAHLDGRVEVARGWQLVAQVRNLFDKAYQSGGVIGANFFTGPDRGFLTPAVPEAFRTPGAPRSVWVGVRYGAE